MILNYYIISLLFGNIFFYLFLYIYSFYFVIRLHTKQAHSSSLNLSINSILNLIYVEFAYGRLRVILIKSCYGQDVLRNRWSIWRKKIDMFICCIYKMSSDKWLQVYLTSFKAWLTVPTSDADILSETYSQGTHPVWTLHMRLNDWTTFNAIRL